MRVDLRAPAIRLCAASPTYELWRRELVAALGRTSGIVKASDVATRHGQFLTWCKEAGDWYRMISTMGRQH